MHSSVCVCMWCVHTCGRVCKQDTRVELHSQCEGHACPCVPTLSVCVCVRVSVHGAVSAKHSPTSAVWCGPCVCVPRCVHTGPACKKVCVCATGMNVCVHTRVQWVQFSITSGCGDSRASVRGSGVWEPPARGCRSTGLCTAGRFSSPRGSRRLLAQRLSFCSAAGRAGKAREEEKAGLTRSLQVCIAVTLPLPSCTFPACSRGKHPSPENIPCPGLGTGTPRGWKMMGKRELPQRAEKGDGAGC